LEGKAMNDLFTLLIILAFIISFLNKIFGQKKPQQTRRPLPGQGQKPREWIPPWLEPEDLEIPDLDRLETKPEEESIEPKPEPISSKITTESQAPKILQQEIALKEIDPHLSVLQFDLSTSDELKKGIVLAEILGRCKGRKNLVKSGSH
jgi:hypothetical protein